jgi:hypothetical protein
VTLIELPHSSLRWQTGQIGWVDVMGKSAAGRFWQDWQTCAKGIN